MSAHRTDSSGSETVSKRRTERIALACRLISERETPPTVTELAREVGMSPHHFHRVFRRITGVTPGAYAAAHRRQRTQQALSEAETVTEAIYRAGYVSTGRFYENSADHLGMSPRHYHRGGEGMGIRFAIGRCSLGEILVAATDRGLCAISLGDDPDQLARDLQDRFPRAELIAGDRDFDQWVARVVGLVESPGTGLDLPLDIQGTAFQQRVWEALRAIPAGETASYAEIARQIGQPTASRAVAAACAANPLAVAIPCHRVVRRDGGLSGYRWGVARKRALLDREKKDLGNT